jgi:hypothetical protein
VSSVADPRPNLAHQASNAKFLFHAARCTVISRPAVPAFIVAGTHAVNRIHIRLGAAADALVEQMQVTTPRKRSYKLSYIACFCATVVWL